MEDKKNVIEFDADKNLDFYLQDDENKEEKELTEEQVEELYKMILEHKEDEKWAKDHINEILLILDNIK